MRSPIGSAKAQPTSGAGSVAHCLIMTQRVNWVLDPDVRSFFDSLDYYLLVRMAAHGIANLRIVEFIEMRLEAGILKGNELHETERGTPQKL